MEMKVTDGIVGKAIGRTNRNLFLLCVCGILIAAGMFAAGFNYWSTLLGGPITLSNEQVINKGSVDFLPSFVSIESVETIDTGYEQYTLDGSVRNTEYYYMAAFLEGDRFLLVEAPTNSTDTQITGALINVPSDVQLEVINAIYAEVSDIDGMFLPVMLTQQDHRIPGYIVGLILLAVMGLSIFGLFRVLARRADISKHPIMQALGRYGDPSIIVKEVEGEMALGSEKVGNVELTYKWAVLSTKTNFEAMRLKDAVWIYKTITQHRTNGIPTGKSYAALIYDKHGKVMTVNAKQDKVDDMLNAIYQRAPWVIAGYSEDLKKTWNDKMGRQEMITAVAQRQSA